MRLNYIPANIRNKRKLIFEFDDIANVSSLLGDENPASVEVWNNFFYLPTYGNPFTSVEIVVSEKTWNNGGLYNWYVIGDLRGICPVGYRVPTVSDYTKLQNNLGQTNRGGKLKETGFLHWNNPNTGATNEFGFNAFGSGCRLTYYGGMFHALKAQSWYWASDVGVNYGTPWVGIAINFSTGLIYDIDQDYVDLYKKQGYSIRFIKDDPTTWISGDTVSDKDENVYPTVKIGDQVWTAQNFRGEHFNNGDPIPYVSDTVDWENLSTAGMCYYENNPANAFGGQCMIYLYGGYDIIIRERLFENNIHLLSIDDYGSIVRVRYAGFRGCEGMLSCNLRVLQFAEMSGFVRCPAPILNFPMFIEAEVLCFEQIKSVVISFPELVTAGDSCWQDCHYTTTFILPKAQYLGTYCFIRCYAVTTIYIPTVQSFGSSIFYGIAGNNILLTVPAAMMVINDGEPDYQIQALMRENDVTVVQV